MTQEFTFRDIIRIKWKHRKLLIMVFVLAAIISAIISFLLPIKYQAEAVMFPAKVSDIVLNEHGLIKGNISELGEIEEAEQFLEIMSANSFKIDIINALDLWAHYGIDSSDPDAFTKIIETFDGNVGVRRSKFNAIKIEVLDTSPHMAAEIANTILDHIDVFRRKLVSQRAKDIVAHVVVKKQVLLQAQDSIRDHMSALNHKGVVSLAERSSIYEAAGHTNRFQAQIDSNLKYGVEYDELVAELDILLDKLSYLSELEDQARTDIVGPLSKKFDIERAFVPEEKAKPKRSVIVLIGTIGAMILAVVLLVLRDRWSAIEDILR